MSQREVSGTQHTMNKNKQVMMYRFNPLPPIEKPLSEETVITPEDFDLTAHMRELAQHEPAESIEDAAENEPR